MIISSLWSQVNPTYPPEILPGKKKSNIEFCNNSRQWSQCEINETSENSKGLRLKYTSFKRDKKNETEKQGMEKNMKQKKKETIFLRHLGN